MYLWKCWHDSRDRVMLYGAAGLAIGVTLGIAHVEYFSETVARYERMLAGPPHGYFLRWYLNPVQLRDFYKYFLQH